MRLIFLLLFTVSLFALPIQDRWIERAALIELAELFNISPDDDIVKATQEKWLRMSGKERWETPELPPEIASFVQIWAKQQGLLDPWLPSEKAYDTALILGATTPRMEKRLQYLARLHQNGTHFSNIVFLTGQRLLDPRVDQWTDIAKTETEAARLVWEKAPLSETMRSIDVSFIDAPQKEGRRPNTQDTIVAWLEAKPLCQKALFISDQPFALYQFAVLKSCLPKKLFFDVAGEGVDPENPCSAAVLLDSLARWIYQENLEKKDSIP